jgi:WD40-like Beta Propeller Repeat
VHGEGRQSSGKGCGARGERAFQRASDRTTRLRHARGRWICALCVLAGGLLTWGAPAQAALVHPFVSQLTGPPPPSEPFSKILCGVNVDPASGDVYVADPGAEPKPGIEKPAIDVFSSASAFVGPIHKSGEGGFREACSTSVNDTTHRVYVANAGEGEGAAEDEKEAVFVYSHTGGEFKFEKPLTLDGSNTPAKTFESLGQFGALEAGGSLHVAVAQKSQDVYVAVAEQGVVDEFNSKGEYLTQLTFPGTPESLATDSEGDLYVAEEREEEGRVVSVIDEFSPSGSQINQITGSFSGGFGHITGVAVDSAGHVYASDGEKRTVDEFDSAGRFMGQMTGSSTPAGSFAEPAGVAVNAEGDVYLADRTQERQPGSPGVVDLFGPATPGAPPFLEGEGVSNVTSTSATLEAQIDPTGLDTTYHFEYAPEGGSFKSLPVPDADIGSGESIQRVSAHLQNLLPSTTYEFRVVVTAKGHESEGSLKTFTFTTQPEGVGFGLPDGRAWELVSPPNKFGGLIKGIGGSGVVQAAADGSRIAYSATSPLEPNVQANAGEAPALSVRGGKGWSTREIMPPDYAKTGAFVTGSRGLENRAFSSDLSHSLVDPFQEEPLLSPEASERAPYLRDLNDVPCLITETTCYTPLATANGKFANVTSEKMPFGGSLEEIFGDVQVVGATPDLSHVVLTSGVALKAGLEGGGLYEWSAGKEPPENLQLVSLLPNGKAVSKVEAAHFGAYNGRENVRHAISSNGSRIAWSTSGSLTHLYVRDTTKGETVQLDTPEEGFTPETGPDPVFQTASANGSMVFFTDEQKLTKDSTASAGKPDLYVCQIGPEEGNEGKLACKLKDLTDAEVVKNSKESAAVQGLVLEASEDGSYVYFVADGVLSNAENAQKEKAAPGSCGQFPPPGATCNLYVKHYNGTEWEEPTFIAAVSSDDGPDWGANASNEGTGRLSALWPGHLTSRVSPNGKYLAFMSDRRLTGYDNTDASPSAGGAADEEVFLYGVSTNRLVCSSCNRSGQRPHGVFDPGFHELGPSELVVDRQNNWAGRWLAANVPGWTEVSGQSALHQSRYLSNSGRLFFNSADALVPADTNLTEDVYQYEPNGVGSCSVPSGCVGLISSGESHEESAFLDASESGNDVFFLTTANLVPQDVDQSFDVYDAHVCTSESPCPAPPSPRPPCGTSAACQGASPQQTTFGAPASATFSGSGNLVLPAHQALPIKIVKLTRAQHLARALKACRRLKHKKTRAACERSARKKYGAKKASKGARKSSRHSRKGSK